MYTLADRLTYTKDIGMYSLNRSIPESCVHKTEVCEARCYNMKLYRIYPGMVRADEKNEIAWADNDAEGLRISLGRKKRQTKRIRLMSRGEALKDFNDPERVGNICKENPQRAFWMPTRAWRNSVLFAYAMRRLGNLANLRILASMDESNTAEDWDHVKNLGLSTMYFDANKDPGVTPNGTRFFKCPKTHKNLKGHCSICRGGCFRTSKRVDVHLLEH